MRKPREPQFTREKRGSTFERMFLGSRTFNRMVTTVGKIVLTSLIWPRFVAPFNWQLTRFDMPMSGITTLAGLKILHLTDLHLGAVKVAYLHSVVRTCLAEKPDLIVITGDLLDYQNTSGLDDLSKILQTLVAGAGQFGVAAIFGNHDYREYSWRHHGPRSASRSLHKRLVKVVQNAGVKLLRNEQLPITKNGNTLTVVGLDEMWTRRHDPAKAFHNLTPTDPVLCLQHNPDGVEFLKNFPWQWMLCGHSHGGQANFPALGALFLPMKHREYLRGFYHFRPLDGQPIPQRTMFVSRGLGYSFPIRVRCSPEASLFTLRPIQ